MNILHLLSQNQLTGAELYAVTLARLQIKNGHKVFQVSNGFYSETLAEKHCLEVECETSTEFKKNSSWLADFIKFHQVHVIHSHSRAAAKMATEAIKKLPKNIKVGHVSTIHGYQRSSLSKILFNHYGQFQIAICSEIKNHLIKDFGYNSRRIQVFPNPIDIERFFWNPKKNNTSKKNKLHIGIIGRTTGPKKDRTEIAIHEFERIAALHKVKISWTIIGGSTKDLKLPNDQLRIEEIEVDHLKSIHFAEFDLVIGSGRVAIESLISGIPIIAFGEARYEGLVTNENFETAQSTNFGDITRKQKTLKIDSIQAEKDFIQVISGRLKEKDLLALSQKTQILYDVKNISSKIQRLYESALLLAIYNKWIPVLMYHKIPNKELETTHRIFVTKENFANHLLFFQKNNFTTLSFKDLKDFSIGIKPASEFPKKPLILTFDDGYLDNLHNASPLLKQLGFKAELFLLADKNISSNTWDTENSKEPKSEIVAGNERKNWKQSAFTIGSHGWAHQRITKMTEVDAKEELITSKKSLEEEFGRTVHAFAYTYGDTSLKSAELAAEAGYDFAVNTDTGGLLLQEDPYQIFRVNIFPEDSMAQIKKKTSSWYRKYYYWKRRK